MITDPCSRIVVFEGTDVAMNTTSLVFDEDLGAHFRTGTVTAVLFTWSLSEFPATAGPPSHCLTKVLMASPASDLEPLLSINSDLPLLAIPALSTFPPELPEPTVKVGSVHTLLTQGYSAQD